MPSSVRTLASHIPIPYSCVFFSSSNVTFSFFPDICVANTALRQHQHHCSPSLFSVPPISRKHYDSTQYTQFHTQCHTICCGIASVHGHRKDSPRIRRRNCHCQTLPVLGTVLHKRTLTQSDVAMSQCRVNRKKKENEGTSKCT